MYDAVSAGKKENMIYDCAKFNLYMYLWRLWVLGIMWWTVKETGSLLPLETLKVCNSSRSVSDFSEDEGIFLGMVDADKTACTLDLKIRIWKVKFKTVTGADVSVVPEQVYKQISNKALFGPGCVPLSWPVSPEKTCSMVRNTPHEGIIIQIWMPSWGFGRSYCQKTVPAKQPSSSRLGATVSTAFHFGILSAPEHCQALTRACERFSDFITGRYSGDQPQATCEPDVRTSFGCTPT